jgi:hypothetical protein
MVERGDAGPLWLSKEGGAGSGDANRRGGGRDVAPESGLGKGRAVGYEDVE